MDRWIWLEQLNTTNDLGIDALVTDSHTTTYQIIHSTSTSIFHPDKRIAAENHKYLSSHRDASFSNVGSILCREINIGNEKKHLRAILSVSTYGKLLCKPDDSDAIHKIENLIIPTFEERLQLELSLLYIKEVLSEPVHGLAKGRRRKK